MSNKINQLLHRLKNAPTGIKTEDLPTEDKDLVAYMQTLFKNKKAIWVRHPDGWQFVLLQEGLKPPFDISVWRWHPPELQRSRNAKPQT